MYIDPNLPTGALGLNPSINERRTLRAETARYCAELERDSAQEISLALAHEMNHAREWAHYWKQSYAIEAAICVTNGYLAGGLESALQQAIEDLSIITNIPRHVLESRYRKVQLEKMRNLAAATWASFNSPYSVGQTVRYVLEQCRDQELRSLYQRLPDPYLADPFLPNAYWPAQMVANLNYTNNQLAKLNKSYRRV